MTGTPLRPEDPTRVGDYPLEALLGEGGQGVVYLGRSGSGEPVAVKLLHSAADSTTGSEARVRLARELAAIQRVAPFCTARVIEANVESDHPYIVSEYVDGPSLQDRVAERGPLRGGELDRLAIGTASALAAIHGAGVVHRDFKPHNVLLGPDGPRVVDFGIARAGDAPTITQGVIGTPGYVAPEQLHGLPATPASDVFTWAATMMYAASGRSPFAGDSVAAILHSVLNSHPRLDDVPPPLRDVLAMCLAKDQAQRPSCRDVMTRLVDPQGHAGDPHGHAGEPGVPAGAAAVPAGAAAVPAGAHGPTSPDAFAQAAGRATAPPPPPPAERPRKRRGGLWAAIAAVVVAGALGAGVTVMFLQTGNAEPPVEPAEAATNPLNPLLPSGDTTPGSGTAPAEGVPVPADFAGTWTGQVEGKVLDDSTESEEVALVLPEGAEEGTYRSKDSSPGCNKATITPTAREGPTLHLTVHGFGGTCGAAKLVMQGTLDLDGDFKARIGNEMLPNLGSTNGRLSRG